MCMYVCMYVCMYAGSHLRWEADCEQRSAFEREVSDSVHRPNIATHIFVKLFLIIECMYKWMVILV